MKTLIAKIQDPITKNQESINAQIQTIKNHNKGFTLIEMSISIAIFSMLFYVLYRSLFLFESGTDDQQYRLYVSTTSKRIVDTIIEELRESALTQITTVLPVFPAFTNQITFSKNTGYNNGIIWSNPISYSTTMHETELDNDIDDNGEGRIDEQRAVRRENNQDAFIATDIRDSSLQFSLENGRVRVDVTVELFKDNRFYTSTYTSSVLPRNQ